MTLDTSIHLDAARRRHQRGTLGPSILAITVAAFALQWLVWLPGRSGRAVYLGQALGSMSVVMMSLALVLVSLGRHLEGLFGGLDRVMMWHRRLAIAGAALILPHIPLATNANNRGDISPSPSPVLLRCRS